MLALFNTDDGNPNLDGENDRKSADTLGINAERNDRVRADWRALDVRDVTGAMTINDRPAGQGTGASVMGHPFESGAWLANTLAHRGRGVKAGEIVLTGSIVETQWLAAGDSVHFDVEGLGTVEISAG